MEFRKLCAGELGTVQEVYRGICKRMRANGVALWDEEYPCEYLEQDVENDRLYALMDEGEILSAFALCAVNEGEEEIAWMEDTEAVRYVNRFGVNAAHAGRGIGQLMLEKAREEARRQGARYLRLFVVDFNVPAIRLYEKDGFLKAEGYYDMVLEDGRVLRQYGYEVRL